MKLSRKDNQNYKANLSNTPIRIRKAEGSDISFIFSSWLKSYRDSYFAENITTTIYYAEHHKVIERLLKGCDVYVACNDNDVAELYGFICGERIEGLFVLHYVYVKQMYRSLGIGTMLLNMYDHDSSTAALYTHHNKLAAKLSSKYNLVHSPYLALTPDYRKEELEPKEPKK